MKNDSYQRRGSLGRAYKILIDLANDKPKTDSASTLASATESVNGTEQRKNAEQSEDTPQ